MIANRKALIVVAAFVLMAIGLPWGGNVPEAFAQISVTAADPPTGEQGALNLNVIIKGKGFKNGAKANWFKTGTTDAAGVNVKSTQFVSSTQLIATIDIADWAALSLFDIEVRNADGRTGKGTELFSVIRKGDTGELSALFQDWPGDMVRSDGLGEYRSPAEGNPRHDLGGVFFDPTYGNLLFSFWVGENPRSVEFEFAPANNLRNAIDNSRTVECREWGGTPFPAREPAPSWLPGVPEAAWFLLRSEAIVTHSVVDGKDVWTSEGTYSNVRDIPVGASVIVGLNMTFKTADGREFWVYFNEEHWGGIDVKLAQGFVKITRETADTWVLEPLGENDPRPLGVVNQASLYAYAPAVRKVHGAGGCDLGTWLMPFRLTLTSIR